MPVSIPKAKNTNPEIKILLSFDVIPILIDKKLSFILLFIEVTLII
jgi:hypothetical protein